DERTVTSGTPLALEEGYELSISAIDIDGNKVYLELSKDGAVVDSKVISPSADNAGMKDKTYYYKKDIGDSKDVVIVAAHFKNAFRGADQNLATVDGLWQLSDTPKDVSENTEYDKMTIQTVTADSISMDIEDNDITLSKNKDISLMPGVSIKTADADELRYYIYKEAIIEGEGEVAEVENETAVVTPVNDTEKVVEEAKESVEEANKTVEEAKEVVEEAKEEVAEAEAKVEETAEAPANQTPGFGSIFALTGLLAVAYLVLSRRD
ncbi:MAG: S-layer protein domain-containing protein, partial [Methanothrix soehngenii]